MLRTLAWGLYPFIIGDLIKIGVASAMLPASGGWCGGSGVSHENYLAGTRLLSVAVGPIERHHRPLSGVVGAGDEPPARRCRHRQQHPPQPLQLAGSPGGTPDRGRYFRAILMTLISDGARSMIFEPENSALARSQGPEEPVLDSCKFQGFVAKFSRYLPLSAGEPRVFQVPGEYEFSGVSVRGV